MGSYVENNLLPGELVMHSSKVSGIIFVPYLILAAAVGGFGFVAGPVGVAFWGLAVLVLVFGVVACSIRKASTEVAVTNKRLILKTGFITRETVEQFLEKIDSISVEQTLVDRMVNAGTIIVRGSGQTFSPVANIDNPLAFRKMVNEQVDKIKSGKN